MIVVQIEVGFEDNEGGIIQETIRDVLDQARGMAAARVVGSYSLEGTFEKNKEWQKKMATRITINSPIEIEIDY